MEFEGVKIDEDFLKDYSKELEKEAKKAEEKCIQTSWCSFQSCFTKTIR